MRNIIEFWSILFKIFVQWRHLRSLLAESPELSSVKFQGIPLKNLATCRGFSRIMHAFKSKNFNDVARNHGICRLNISQEEVIWSTNHAGPDLIFEDSVITLLEENWRQIWTEIKPLLEMRKKFPDSDDLTQDIGQWDFLSFLTKTGEPEETLIDRCPETWSLLNKLPLNPTFGFCFVSILTPGTRIAPHRGSSNMRQRYHLCLQTDHTRRAQIRVGEQWIDWTEGSAFGFNDSLEHEVVYEGNIDRVVLIVDVWPPRINSGVKRAFENNSSGILNFCTI